MDIHELSTLLDSKLESIKNSIKTIEIDMHAIKVHVEAINNRLFNLENRQAMTELKTDQLLKYISHPEELSNYLQQIVPS